MKKNAMPRKTSGLDTVFVIAQEMIEGKGEDSYYCSVMDDTAIIGVFDGSGGLGARTYQSFNGHTGAYIGSRLVCGAVHDWFQNYSKIEDSDADDLLLTLRNSIQSAFSIGKEYAESNVKILGSMSRDLPTTAAIGIVHCMGDKCVLRVIWAGDSRVYLLNGGGLHQLTQDDSRTVDAYENLTDDAVMTNVLAADGRYALHCRTIDFNEPVVIIVATDGCYGYIPSPMEFEYMIVSNIANGKNINECEQQIKRDLNAVAGDDFTMGVMAFGYHSFEVMQSSFKHRESELMTTAITGIMSSADDDVRSKIWQTYRIEYEKYFAIPAEERVWER